MRARLARYGLWQARDFVFERGFPILLIGALLIFAVREGLNEPARAIIAAGGDDARFLGARVMQQVLEGTWFVFALIAVHGISGNDRSSGRFRFIFAKPVSVLRYYAQAYAIGGLLTMVCAALVIAGTTMIAPIAGTTARDALAVYLAAWLLVGGICFFFSAIWRFDWVATAAAVGAAGYLASHWAGAAWLRPLPPVLTLWRQAALLKEMAPLDWRGLVWAGAYGVACFLLGLVVLRRRPLAT